MQTYYEHVPNEVLTYIFNFLHVVSIARCAQVCKQWYRVTNHYIIWERIARFRYAAHFGPSIAIIIRDDNSDEYSSFSMFDCKFPFRDGTTWKSIYHWYQSHKYPMFSEEIQKLSIKEIKAYITWMKKNRPQSDKKVFQEQKQISIMQAMYLKITEHPDLLKLLCKTDLSQIIYRSKNLFWGENEKGEGLNRYGKLLMKVRRLIRREVESWDFLLPEYNSSNTSKKNWKKVCIENYRTENNWFNGRCMIKTIRVAKQGLSQFSVLRVLPSKTAIVRARSEGSHPLDWIEVWDLSDNTISKGRKTTFLVVVDDAVGKFLLSRTYNWTTNCNEVVAYDMVSFDRVRSIPVYNHYIGNRNEEPFIATSNGLSLLTIWNISNGEKLISVELESTFKLQFFGYPYAVVQYSNDPECIGVVDVSVNFSSRLFRHHADVRYITMSPDGTKLGVGLDTNEIVIWNTDNGKKLNTLKIKEKMESPLEFAMDNYKLIVVVENGVEIWDLENSNGHSSVLYIGKTRSLHLVGDSLICYSRLFLDSASWKQIDCAHNHPTHPILISVLHESGELTEHPVLAHQVIEFSAKTISCNEFQISSKQVYEKNQQIVVYALLKYGNKDSQRINSSATKIPKIGSSSKKYQFEGYWAKKSRLVSVPYPLLRNEENIDRVEGPVCFYCEKYVNERGWEPSDCTAALVSEFLENE